MISKKVQHKLRRFKLSSRQKLTGGLLLLAGIFFVNTWNNFFQENSIFAPDNGGIFTEATIGVSKNINPLSAESSVFDKDLQTLIFSGLLEYNPIVAQFEPALGSFRISEDGLHYLVTLKNSAKFSNGDLVSVEDVIFTYETVIKNPNFRNQPLAQQFEYVTIEREGERILRFTLPEPNAFFPFALTTPILHAESYQNALLEEVIDPTYPPNKRPIGAGPFRLKNIIPEDDGGFRVFLERNKHYFKKTPYIKQVVLYVYPTFDHLRFQHDWPTMFSQVPATGQQAFQQSLFEEYQLREYILPRYLGLFFNLDRPIINNPYFRNALAFAIDKEKLLDNNLGWNQVDSLFFFEGVEAWHEVDLNEANKILQQNSFPYSKKQTTRIHKKKPVSLRLITSVAPPVYSRISQNLAQLWEKELNIHLEVDILSPAEFDQAVKDRDYDLVLFGNDFSENANSLSSWHSSQTNKLNLSNLTNTNIDFIINEIYLTGTQSELFQLGQKISDITPAVAIATPQYNLFIANQLKGFSESFGKLRKHGNRFYGIENWHFEQKRVWDLTGKSKTWEFLGFLF